MSAEGYVEVTIGTVGVDRATYEITREEARELISALHKALGDDDVRECVPPKPQWSGPTWGCPCWFPAYGGHITCSPSFETASGTGAPTRSP